MRWQSSKSVVDSKLWIWELKKWMAMLFKLRDMLNSFQLVFNYKEIQRANILNKYMNKVSLNRDMHWTRLYIHPLLKILYPGTPRNQILHFSTDQWLSIHYFSVSIHYAIEVLWIMRFNLISFFLSHFWLIDLYRDRNRYLPTLSIDDV